MVAQIIGTGWMLLWFVYMLRMLIKWIIKDSGNLYPCLLVCIIGWVLLGFCPIAIIKFGWNYIGRG